MGKAESILVVDDVKEHCEIAFRILKKTDYLVTSVSSGEEALYFRKNRTGFKKEFEK